MSPLGESSSMVLMGNKKGGVSQMFIHQWLKLCHFVSMKETKIKINNVSEVLMVSCTICGDDDIAFNDIPGNVQWLHQYIKESDANIEEVLLDV